MSYFSTVTIEYLDETTEVIEWVTSENVKDGVLSLFKKNGQLAFEEHLGSYPLTSIKKWTRRER